MQKSELTMIPCLEGRGQNSEYSQAQNTLLSSFKRILHLVNMLIEQECNEIS
jgi:hypothetical protein